MKRATSQGKRQSMKIFPGEENQCVWMKAGVVNYKLCENAYDCLTCPFDKAMSRAAERKPEKAISWRDVMKSKEYHQRECRHMLTGRVHYRFCSNGYRCDICEFDQALDENDLAASPAAAHLKNVAGFHVADGYHYHRGHSWARVEHGGFVRIGIDDFALKLLGHPTDVKLPKLGAHVEQTNVGWTIHRDNRKADVLAPINGVVLATNHKAVKQPDTMKKDPYGEGWLMVIEPRNLKKNLKNLLFDQEAALWTQNEAQRLESIVMAAYGRPLAATGGEVVDDIFGNLPDMKWEDLVHEFLLT